MGNAAVSLRSHLAAAALVCALPAGAASAQADADAKWLVLPSVVAAQGDPQHPARTAARLLGEELHGSGVRAFKVEQAKRLFEQHGSAPPMTASAADIDDRQPPRRRERAGCERRRRRTRRDGSRRRGRTR